MKKPKKSTIVSLLVFVLLFVIYFVVIVILQLPFYVMLLVYAAFIVGALIIFRSEIQAIIGNVYYIVGKGAKSRKYLKKAIDNNTKSPVAHLNYSIMIMREDGNTKDAFPYLFKARQLNKAVINDKNIMTTIGTCYWLSGDIDKAIETIEELRSKYEYVNGNVLTTLGYMYFLKEDYETAIELTNKAIEDMPEHGSAWDNLGQIYFKTGNIEKAKENFEKALTYKESLVDSLYFMGLLYENENNTEKAIEYFNKAHLCDITKFNTVTKEEVEEKYNQYNREQ